MERSEISTIDIATKIAPRMNSLGRVAEPRKGVEMLLVREVQHLRDLQLREVVNSLLREERYRVYQLV